MGGIMMLNWKIMHGYKITLVKLFNHSCMRPTLRKPKILRFTTFAITLSKYIFLYLLCSSELKITGTNFFDMPNRIPNSANTKSSENWNIKSSVRLIQYSMPMIQRNCETVYQKLSVFTVLSSDPSVKGINSRLSDWRFPSNFSFK